MALSRKYAALPDLDSAPDIYETPELTDDNSTVPGTTVRSQSEDEFDDDGEDDDATGISRSRLRIDQARSRFLPAGVDAGEVDFSDRVDGKRKSYKASTRRQRILDDGEEIDDSDEEGDQEGLERKLARLRRELEEVKEEYGKRRQAGGQPTERLQRQEKQVASLSHVLEEISLSTEVTHGSSKPSFATGLSAPPTKQPAAQASGDPTDGPTYSVTYAPSYEQSHALAKAADFDHRLLLLEKAIGISSTAVPGVDATGLPRAIMPTLDTLQRQISTLSQATTSNLDTASRRIRTLIQEAEKLEKARLDAKAAQEALGTGPAKGAVGGDEADQAAKINALYGTLPTIEGLSPLLPALLDRLRSLRSLHADAATASETLDRIEKQQTEMAAELKQWREGLEKVEGAMRQGGAAMEKNRSVIEGWVKDLEARMEELS